MKIYDTINHELGLKIILFAKNKTGTTLMCARPHIQRTERERRNKFSAV